MSKRRRHEQQSRTVSDIDTFLSWSNCYQKASKWFLQYDLEEELDKNGGLVQLHDFLPARVAQGALEVVQQVPEAKWNATTADHDVKYNNISHNFASVKDPTAAHGLEQLFRLFHLLLPEELNSFSIARYTDGHHIAPHDDRAYTDVRMEDGQTVECSRTIAVIYYLTKDWQESYGGLLRDCVTDKVFIPEFNSVIAFRVPRYHQVTAMRTSQPRYTVFGWFLQPGRLYDLYTGDDAPPEAATAQSEPEVVRAAAVVQGFTDVETSDGNTIKRQRTSLTDIDLTHDLSTCLSSKSMSDSKRRFGRVANRHVQL